MNVRVIFSMAVLSALLIGCGKPEARFSIDKKEYQGGDTVHLRSNSLAADTFIWMLNDQVIGHTPNLDVVLEKNARGPQVFTLKAGSAGKDPSIITQTVMATSVTGTLSVWGSFSGIEIFEVADANQNKVGSTSSGFTEDPGCGAAGSVQLVLSPGTYTVDGVSEVTRSRKVVTLQANECLSVRMH